MNFVLHAYVGMYSICTFAASVGVAALGCRLLAVDVILVVGCGRVLLGRGKWEMCGRRGVEGGIERREGRRREGQARERRGGG